MTTTQPNHTTHEQAPEPEVPPALKPPSSTLGAWVLLHLAFGLYVVSQLFLTKLSILWGTAVGQILFLLLPALLFARWKSPSVKAALRLRPVPGAIWWRVTLLALTGVGASILLGHLTVPWVARYFADWIPILEFMEQLLTPKTASGLVRNLVVIGLVAPVCEEVLFRGAFQGTLEQRGPVRAIAWTAFIFGVIHLNPFNFIGPILYGVGLGFVVWRTGSILPAILWHALNNSVVVLLAARFGPVDSIPPWGVWVCGGLTILFGLLLWEFIRHTRTSAPAPSPLATAPAMLHGGNRRVAVAGAWGVALLFIATVCCFGHARDGTTGNLLIYTRKPLSPFIQVGTNDIILWKDATGLRRARVARLEGDRVMVRIEPQKGAPYEYQTQRNEIIGKAVWEFDPGKEIKELQRQIEAKRSENQPASNPAGTKSAETSLPKSQTLKVTDPGRPTVVNLISNEDDLPEVELTVNGRPARFLVDTGADGVYVLESSLEKLGLAVHSEYDIEFSGDLGRSKRRTGIVKTVTLGIGDGTTVRVKNVRVLPPHDSTYDGLLGSGFLEVIGGVIDLGGGTLRIEGRSAAPAHPSDGKSKPTEPQTKQP